MSRTKSLLLCLLSAFSCLAQDMTCPTGDSTAPSEFYVIGASGGDSKNGCENTAAATTEGLARGINAVELDLSMSEDHVVFLWNDPNPIDPSSQARSQGLFVNGMCRPVFNTLVSARGQVFSHILENFGYINETGVDQQAVIPTLHEWMNEFAENEDIKLIILDIKVEEIDQADYLVEHIMEKANSLGVGSKIRMLSSSYSMTAALQSSLARAQEDKDIASRVWGGTTITLHFGSTANFDGVSEARDECYGLTSVGQSISSDGWSEYQKIVQKMVATRDEEATAGNKYIPVLTWRINSVEKMAWLMCAGVDGVYTDEPDELSMLTQRKTMGHIVCCARDVDLGCLLRTDTRLSGQGCTTYGLSWHDQLRQPCPYLPAPLNFFNSGTQLVCRESRFARMDHDSNCS